MTSDTDNATKVEVNDAARHLLRVPEGSPPSTTGEGGRVVHSDLRRRVRRAEQPTYDADDRDSWTDTFGGRDDRDRSVLGLVDAHALVRLRDGRRIFVRVVSHDATHVIVAPWGCPDPLRISLRDVRSACAANGLRFSVFRQIAAAQRRDGRAPVNVSYGRAERPAEVRARRPSKMRLAHRDDDDGGGE
jgi:hypothetical protein